MEYIRIISDMARGEVGRSNLTPEKAAIITAVAITAVIILYKLFGKRR